jgi:predicted transcriptional regulator
MTLTASRNLELDSETEARLQRLANARHRPADLLMREAIQQYVEREERREELRNDALAAWSEYQATGRHVASEEADAWLARLEAGEDVEPPLPHE